LGKMIQNGIDLEKEGKSYDEIVRIIRTYPDKTEMYLLPASFDQLRRSGRVSKSQALFASLLKMHVILGFDEGKVIVEEKVRTQKRAKRRFFEIINNAVETHQ